MKLKPKYLIPILVVAIAFIAWRVASSKANVDARKLNVALVKVEPPKRETVLYQLTFSGDVLPVQQANIFSRVSGNLDRVHVNIGDYVRDNQLLALIDTTELAQIYEQTLATYENARSTYERNQQLAGENLIAKQDLDNAATASKVAKENYDAAATRLGYARITAPFAGFITKRYLDPGANVTSNNSTLFTLMSLEQMKVIINVLEADIPKVTVGTKVSITVDAYPAKQFEGTVTRISQAVDMATRTMATEIDIPNSGHLLKPGMFATVTLIIEQHPNAITVPTYALLKDDKGVFVYVTDGQTARRKPVKPGIEQNARTEILAGLTGDEQVITTGQQFTRDGGPVKVQ